jgi:TonB family protein
LGEAYAFASIGVSEMGLGKTYTASVGSELPSTTFALLARRELQQSPDLVLLTSALSGLKRVGTDLKRGSGLPQGFVEFCNSVVARIRELKPNSEHDCNIPNEQLPSAEQRRDLQRTMVTKRTAPTYPQAAKNERLGGTLILHATIDKQGKVRDVGYLGGPLVFYPGAAPAIRQWEYKPYTIGGVAVEVPAEIEVTFTIN